MLFSHQVVSDSSWPHRLQHVGLPCPSPSPVVCPNSCPWSQWCHPAISPSVTLFSFCLQSFPASGNFPLWCFHSIHIRWPEYWSFSVSFSPAIRVVSSAYLRLLIFLLANLIPACESSSLAFHIIYSAYKLNKQGDNIYCLVLLLSLWNQSSVPCSVLTVASWPEYRFLRRLEGNLIFPSFEEFSVCCDLQSQSKDFL